jgi:collagen type VII alpha
MKNRYKHLSLGLVGITAAVAVACSSDPENNTGSSGNGGSSGTSGNGGSSGASGNGGSSGTSGNGGSSGASGSKSIGIISVSQSEIVAGTFQTTAIASFSKASGQVSSDGPKCTTSNEGACVVSVCDLTPPPDGGAPPPSDAGMAKAPNAGEITISGGDTPISLTVEANGTYKAFSAPKKAFSSGATLVAKAPGADVPAIDQSLAAPSAISVTAPMCASAMCGELDTAADFAPKWTGGTAGKVTVTLSNTTKVKATTAICTFDAASNGGTVPKAALAGFSKDATATTIVSVSASSIKTFTAGEYEVTYSIGGGGQSGLIKVKP